MNHLPPSPIGAATDSQSRRERITRLVDECLVRLTEGQSVSEAALLQTHEELMPELGEELRRLRLFAGACQLAGLNTPEGSTQDGTPQVASHQSRSVDLLRIRCPHCHSSIDVHVETSLADVACTACGQRFNLVGDEPITPDDGANRQLQHFELLEQIGTGGFGTVWKARDKELDRLVAVKFPRRGQLSPDETQQFLREARAAAQLQHPSIVSVHEVGRDADRIYIVSDLVEGPSLAEWNNTGRMSVREAAAFCQKVAEALSHAHAAGIIHRDLKPANILIDAEGQPHLTDFGLASRRAQETTVTLDGQMLGTPAYMSPEQARGEAHSADYHSDIFSLGVILYELLTGELPFRGSVRMLLEQIIANDPTRLRSLNSLVPRDLETICLKCLEKDSARRYLSARHLAEDLGRFQRSEPIIARPVGRFERTWRWCKRKPAQAALVAVLALVGVATPIAALHQRASRQAAQLAAEAARWQQYLSDMHAATMAWDDSDVGRVLAILERNRPALGQPDLRRFEWYYLWRLCQPSLAVPTFQHADGVWALALTSNGSKLIAGLRSSFTDDVIHIWDVPRRIELQSLSGPNWPQAIAISPDDGLMATGGVEDIVRLWDVATGSQLHELVGHTSYTWGVAFSPDGELVASSSPDHTVRLWDAKTGEPVHKFTDERAKFTHALAFAPDGSSLAAGTEDGSVMLWHVPSRTLTHTITGHTGEIASLVFSRDGRILVTGGADRIVRLWNPTDGTLRTAFSGHMQPIGCVDISPDGSTVASAGGQDGTIRVWDITTGTEQHLLRGHSGRVNVVRFSSDGTLFSGGVDGAVKAWDLTRPADVNVLRGDTFQTWSVQISPDGKTVIAGGGDGTVRVWDLQTGQLLTAHTLKAPEMILVALSPDGRLLAIGGQDSGFIEVWNPTTEDAVVLLENGSEVTSLAWSHDGRTLVSGTAGDNGVILWDPDIAKQRTRLPGHKRSISSVAFSPDDRTLAVRCEDDTLRIWDPSTGALLKTIEGLSGSFFSPMAFSADGTLLACVDLSHVIQIRETAGWKVVRTAVGHTDHVKGLAFSPDGRTLASASDDGTIRLWEVATGEERCMLRGHLGEVEGVKFTPDGQTLVSCGQDGTVRRWRASSPADVDRPRNR